MRTAFFLTILSIYLASCAPSFHQEIKSFRAEYKSEFGTDPRSPLNTEEVKHLDFFPANKEFHFKAKFTRTAQADIILFHTSSDAEKQYRPYGLATFHYQGQDYTVTIYQSLGAAAMPGYENYLFLPFNDLTNGTETYGGGRYIDLTTDVIQGDQVVIDFNKAYNPWCAYGKGGPYSCPIPPVDNKLALRIEAGEKNWIEH